MRLGGRSAVRFGASVLMVAALASCSADDVAQIQPVEAIIARPHLARKACHSVSRDVLRRTYNGTDPVRSGDIQLIPRFPNFVSGGLTHATPFGYTQHVPLLLYGPGFVRPGRYDRPAVLTDVPATTAALLKFDRFHAPDGKALSGALLPEKHRRIPRLVVTMVWDAAGMDLLDRWPRSWPYLDSLRRHGAWFTHATVNSSPTNTPPAHAMMGTGAYPRTNGIVDEYSRIGGTLRTTNEGGPAALRLPTLADLYDRAMGNRPVVAGLGSLSAHLLMMSHGLAWKGGDADIGVTREVGHGSTGGSDTGNSWRLTQTMAPNYRFPRYVNGPKIEAVFKRSITELDQADGKLDGRWRDNSIERLIDGLDTPARTPYQTALFETVVRREKMGADRVPDMLFLNYKVLDSIGHFFSADGPELADALRVQDRNLRAFVRFLNRQVGKRQWALILTADHGMQRDPAESGAFTIDINRLTSAIDRTFGGPGGEPVVERTRPTQIWLDTDRLEANGYTLSQVSTFIMDLTQAQTAPHGVRAPAPQAPVFEAVFPSSVFDQMACLPEAFHGGKR